MSSLNTRFLMLNCWKIRKFIIILNDKIDKIWTHNDLKNPRNKCSQVENFDLINFSFISTLNGLFELCLQ